MSLFQESGTISPIHMASHFHYYKKYLVSDGLVQSRLHVFWFLFLYFQASGIDLFGGTCWCQVLPNKWHGTANSVKRSQARASDRSTETRALNLNGGGVLPWGSLCLLSLRSSYFLQSGGSLQKVLYCLVHGNLVLSKHTMIRIHPEVSLGHKILCLPLGVCYSLSFRAGHRINTNDYHAKENKSSFCSIKDIRNGNVFTVFKLPIGSRRHLFKSELFKHS